MNTWKRGLRIRWATVTKDYSSYCKFLRKSAISLRISIMYVFYWADPTRMKFTCTIKAAIRFHKGAILLNESSKQSTRLEHIILPDYLCSQGQTGKKSIQYTEVTLISHTGWYCQDPQTKRLINLLQVLMPTPLGSNLPKVLLIQTAKSLGKDIWCLSFKGVKYRTIQRVCRHEN